MYFHGKNSYLNKFIYLKYLTKFKKLIKSKRLYCIGLNQIYILNETNQQYYKKINLIEPIYIFLSQNCLIFFGE